ncbi:MAG: hypothetical protein ABW092_19445, partial [Candidatus Thiodiazotropha sp.]
MKQFSRIVPILFLLSIYSHQTFSACTSGYDSNSVCISTSVLQWVSEGDNDFFTDTNWEYGALIGGPAANPSLTIGFGPWRRSHNGVPSGYDYGSSVEAILASDYTSTGNLIMYTGIDTTLTIRNATYSLANADIGLPAIEWPNDPLTTSGNATVNIDNGAIEGYWNFYEGSTLNILGGNFDPAAGVINGPVPNLNISSGATYRVNGTTAGFSNVVENNGTIVVQGSDTTGVASFSYDGGTILLGTGELVLTDAENSSLAGHANGLANDQLTNSAGHTIRGQGYITGDIVNQGVMRAEGGRITLDVASFDNTSGLVEIAADGELYNPYVSATDFGDLAIEQGGGVVSYSHFDDVNLVGPGDLNITPGSVSFSGTVTNNGRINVQASPTSGVASFSYDGGTILSGTGELVLTDAENSSLAGHANGLANDQLTNSAGHTIRGQGYITGDIVNQGVMRAEGGRITLDVASFDNTSGLVEIAADGELYNPYVSATDFGDLAIEQGGGVVSYSHFDDVNLVGPGDLNITPGSVSFSGTVTNNGRINVQASPTSGVASFSYDGGTTLSGTGELVLTDAENSSLVGYANGLANDQLTNSAGHTIRGQGYISGDIVNQGVVRSEGTGMVISSNMAGQGTLDVSGTSTLLFEGTQLTQGAIN